MKDNTRKILYSPGYGAGWVSWHRGSRAEKLFMLEYAPFIKFLEESEDNKLDPDDEHVKQFKKDWDIAFPESAGDYPYTCGLEQLEVVEVGSDCSVMITEYDGYEEVKTLGEQCWL